MIGLSTFGNKELISYAIELSGTCYLVKTHMRDFKIELACSSRKKEEMAEERKDRAQGLDPQLASSI